MAGRKALRRMRRQAGWRWYRPQLVVLEDRTLPSFITAPTYPAGNRPFSVAVEDFNGDGIPDLAVADNGNVQGIGQGVSVLLGNGEGSFQPPRTYATGTNPQAVAVGDFNGDGIPDLAVVSTGSRPSFNGTVSVLLGNGDGSFQPARNFAAGVFPDSLAVGDFNGDGIPDLAVANNSGTLSVFLGVGDGSFQPARSFAAGFNPNFVVVGDFNGDGIPDLAVAGNGVNVLLGVGDGTFQPARNYAAGINPVSLAVGDFNGDGIPDLAVANNESNDVSVLLGVGDGSFQPARNYVAGILPDSVVVGDFNGDGIPDIAVANEDNFSDQVSLLLGGGDGFFQPARTFGTGGTPWQVIVADFTGDGIPDLATVSVEGVTVLLNDGIWHTAPGTGPHPGQLPAHSPKQHAAGDVPQPQALLATALLSAENFSRPITLPTAFVVGESRGTPRRPLAEAPAGQPTRIESPPRPALLLARRAADALFEEWDGPGVDALAVS